MALVVILVLFIVFAPITISIVAIVKATGLTHLPLFGTKTPKFSPFLSEGRPHIS